MLAKSAREGQGPWANVGLRKEIQIDRALKPGVRVTVEMPCEGKKEIGKVVSPRTPREVRGTYWGYQVRLASSFSRVLTEAPFQVSTFFSVLGGGGGRREKCCNECDDIIMVTALMGGLMSNDKSVRPRRNRMICGLAISHTHSQLHPY